MSSVCDFILDKLQVGIGGHAEDGVGRTSHIFFPFSCWECFYTVYGREEEEDLMIELLHTHTHIYLAIWDR